MSAATRIHLVRHGRTPLNAEGRFRGRLDPPLDDQGLAEASAAARGLAPFGIRAVYTSRLRRARETASAIAEATGAPVRDESGLVDLDYGTWQGLTPEEAAARDPEAYDRFLHAPLEAATPGGEMLGGVLERLADALGRIGKEHSGASVAAVSHEVPIRLLVAHLTGPRDERMWGLHLPTGSVITVVAEGSLLRLAAPAPRQ